MCNHESNLFHLLSLIKDMHVLQVARGLNNEIIAGVVVKILKSQLWLVGTEPVKIRLDHWPSKHKRECLIGELLRWVGGLVDSACTLWNVTCRSQEFSYTSTERVSVPFSSHSAPQSPHTSGRCAFLFFNPATTLNPCLQKEANRRLVLWSWSCLVNEPLLCCKPWCLSILVSVLWAKRNSFGMQRSQEFTNRCKKDTCTLQILFHILIY